MGSHFGRVFNYILGNRYDFIHPSALPPSGVCPGFLHLVSHSIRSAFRGTPEKTATVGRNLGPLPGEAGSRGRTLLIWSRNRHVVELVERDTHLHFDLNERVNANAV